MMRATRSRAGRASAWGLLAAGLPGLVGCGSGGQAGEGKVVYSSPEEVDKKKAELFDAMKGGAYGSAGRVAAPQVDPRRK